MLIDFSLEKTIRDEREQQVEHHNIWRHPVDYINEKKYGRLKQALDRDHKEFDGMENDYKVCRCCSKFLIPCTS